jgi:tetratricopeptide (TPR) repeat protein
MSEVAEAPKGRTKTATAPLDSPDRGLGRLADAGLIVAFLALTFLLGVFPLKDTDFWWHLRTGDLIRQTGKVPTVDTYTFGAEGQRWIDLHWIFQLLMSYGYQTVGIVGLNLGKCVVTCLAVGLLVTSRKRDWPVWTMLLAWLPALFVLSGRMYLRPETLTFLYLSMYLAILSRIDDRPKLAFLLPIVQLAWVNTQGLFVLGPGLLVFALIGFAVQPKAFRTGRIGWWRTILIASALVGLVCLINPYGLAGALFPLQLVSTMKNPVFRETIAELKPMDAFIGEAGFRNGPLQLHLATIFLGVLSFFILIVSRVVDRARRASREVEAPVDPKKAKKARKKVATAAVPVDFLLFRLILFMVFTVLSWQATRNSHQFAAVAGTVTAWNFGEWASTRVRNRRENGDAGSESVGRIAAFGAIAGAFVLVASGGFYAWTAEGRTIGLGEERLWFPHEAVAFAGRADMPTRSVCFHNGHAALYEYAYAPERKTYLDARLEVIGPEKYQEYVRLESKISHNETGWTADLDAMQRPIVLVDNVHATGSGLNASLLASKKYRCVWFDPIAALYIHEAYKGAAEAHAIDFAERHFRGKWGHSGDLTAETMQAKTCWNLMFTLVPTQNAVTRQGWRELTAKLLWKGLDHTAEIRRLDPANLDGWKWAGMIEFYREPPGGGEPIARYRMGFDPVFDLSSVRAAYLLHQALDRSSDDGNALATLASLDIQRGMFETALPLLDRFLNRPASGAQERSRQTQVGAQRVRIVSELGLPPESLSWENLSGLERLVSSLYAHGRAATAADVLESAYPVETRPWEIADRIATIRLHLGQPDRAYRIWTDAKAVPSEALRNTRQAAALFARTDYDAARSAYQAAIRLDPKRFEALFGLAILESDLGHASDALAALDAAERVVPHSAAGSALDRLRASVMAYAKP